MSGLCGILRFDGAPADGGLLERMMARMGGEGGAASFREGPAALGWIGSAAAEGPERGLQPLLDGPSGLVLLLDGRIDDREELAASLRQGGGAAGDGTDAALLLAALAADGEAVLDRLCGDYAFVLFDPRRRRLLAARDCMGLRPFYYASDGAHFSFASTPLALREDPAFRGGPDEGILGEWLAEQEVHPRATLYEGILRLPPGHLLEAEGGVVRTRRWWRPVVEGRSRGRSEGEWVEEFRALLRTAVGGMLRTGAGAGILLSGGVDSGAVGRFAAAAAGGSPGGGRLRAWTITFPGRPFDEGPAARVSAGDALEFHPVPWERAPAPPGFPLPDGRGLPGGDFLLGNYRRTCALAAAAGDRVLLTGDGGDEWFGSRREDLFLCLAEFRWIELLRRMRRLSGGGPRGVPSLLARHVLQPLLPGLLSPLLARRAASPERHPWFEPAFLRRLDLPARLLAADREVLGGVGPSARFAARTCYGWWQSSCETQQRAALDAGVELRHPLLHRRVVEFALRTPPSLRCDGTATKRILRAAAPLLPRETAVREEKPHATPLLAENGPAAGGRFPLLEGRGILRPGAFPGGAPPGSPAGNARLLAESLEGWLGLL